MKESIPHLFAAVRSMAEEVHSIAVEGQRRDNAADMQRVLVSQLRMTISAMDGLMGKFKNRLGNGDD